MMKQLIVAALMLLLVTSLTTAAPETLKVGVAPLEPFVELPPGGESPKGFDVELIEALSKELGWDQSDSEVRLELIRHSRFSDVLEAVESGACDIALAGITVTKDREQRFDFSYPYMDSGLAIMIPKHDLRPTGLFSSLGNAVTSRAVSQVLLVVALFVLGSAHVIWLAERGSEAFHDNYIPGVLEGCWWAVVTMTTVGYGDKVPEKWLSRAVGAVIMVVGIMTFSTFTAVIASSLTLDQADTHIKGPEDLTREHRIGCVKATTSQHWLAKRGLPSSSVQPFDKLSHAARALEAREIDALVFDAPMLRYLSRSSPKLHVLPTLFAPQKYGVLMPLDSPWRKQVNAALLSLETRGELSRLKSRYFPS
jgi:polar amino acid transport system substrate-binding protein